MEFGMRKSWREVGIMPTKTDMPSKGDLCFGRKTIHHEPWWLDIVTSRTWDMVSVEEGSRCVAWMPYVLTKRFGFVENVMPLATSFLGPVLEEHQGGVVTKTRRQLALTTELISKLPNSDKFCQKFHSSTENVMPFQAAGYNSFVQHNFLVVPSAEDTLWSSMRDKTRNVIRKSQQNYEIETITDVDKFFSSYSSNLTIRGLKSSFEFRKVEFLISECLQRNRGKILGIRNHNGCLLSAVVYVWDDQVAYYKLSTRNINDKNNGAISHLIWQAIKDVTKQGKTFDFDGVPNIGSAKFFSGFGGQVVPRYGAEKSSYFYNICQGVSRLVSGRQRTTRFY